MLICFSTIVGKSINLTQEKSNSWQHSPCIPSRSQFTPPQIRRMTLSHVHVSCQPKAGCKREGTTLTSRALSSHGKSQNHSVWSTPAQLLLADYPVKTWSCLGHTGRHLRAANGQKTTKCPYSHTACSEFPSMLAPAEAGWIVASTPTAQCTSHTLVYNWSTYGHAIMSASQEGPNRVFCKMLSMLKMIVWLYMCLYFRCPKFSLLN